eukprot:5610475-Prymnesium_polylepis.1
MRAERVRGGPCALSACMRARLAVRQRLCEGARAWVSVLSEIKKSGCDAPRDSRRPSTASRARVSASPSFPWSLSTFDRLVIMPSVSGCLPPSRLRVPSSASRASVSASDRRPRIWERLERLPIACRVSGCVEPLVSRRPSTSCRKSWCDCSSWPSSRRWMAMLFSVSNVQGALVAVLRRRDAIARAERLPIRERRMRAALPEHNCSMVGRMA